jgi:hypothetical protein
MSKLMLSEELFTLEAHLTTGPLADKFPFPNVPSHVGSKLGLCPVEFLASRSVAFVFTKR